MDQNQMTVEQKIDALGNVLDKIGDIPGGGRGKCGLVWVANDLLSNIAKDVLYLKSQIKNSENKSEEPIEIEIPAE